MDLGAFLEPGVYPVYRLDDETGAEPWGHIVRRGGRRLVWLSLEDPLSEALMSGVPLCLSLSVPEHRLLSDGSLSPSPGESAPLHLACEVAASRSWPERSMFVLRFKSLIRLL
jgi:hypothetical protein